MTATWSPQFVEELLYRQYIKGEDVSMLLPPPPSLKTDRYMEVYDQSTKVLFSYVRNGPTAALSSQNVNTSSKGYNSTPIKSQSFARAANQPQVASALNATVDPKSLGCRTPKAKEAPPSAGMNSPVPQAAAQSPLARQESVSPTADARKNRTEAVPSNNSLKSNSRSKVAHLTAKRVAAQEKVDPDLIFAQNPGELPLHLVFASYPKALQSLANMRGASGDWRNDTFTADEENLYKRELGYAYVGPSQCAYGKSKLFSK